MFTNHADEAKWAKVVAITSGAGANNIVHQFQTLTRKHGVRCKLGQTTQTEVYVSAMADVGSAAIVAASKMYGKAVFFLESEAAANEVIEKGIVVGRLVVQVELLSSPGTTNHPL